MELMEIKMKNKIAFLVASVFIFCTGSLQAAVTTYSGADLVGSAGDPSPSSAAAALAFDTDISSLGLIHTIDFESVPLGYAPVINLDANTTATFNGDIDPAYSGVTASDNVVLGFNTTAGGSNHLRMSPTPGWTDASVTLTFIEPVIAFGGYFTGLEERIVGTVDVLFNDGSSESFGLGDLNKAFFGFTTDSSIMSVTFNEINGGTGIIGSREIWGMDDLVYVTASVPEASSIMLLGLGLAGLGFSRRKKTT